MLPGEKLARSLEILRQLQSSGRGVFRSSELSRTHRERLIANGFLLAPMKGWLVSASPDTADGDSTPWYASFWEFCAAYCEDRFGNAWHLSPQHSLLLLTEELVVPTQLIVRSEAASNNAIELPFDTSILLLRSPTVTESDATTRLGVRVISPALALAEVPAPFFERHPVAAQAAIGMVRNAAALLRPLLAGGHSARAGRLAGAFRRAGRAEVADEIMESMKAAGYDVRETDPFEPTTRVLTAERRGAPIMLRIRALWEACRETVIETFPPALATIDAEAYVDFVEEQYATDAYHSLSIEGYRVSDALIDRVKSGAWDPDGDDGDDRDALAARGFREAFILVEDAIGRLLAGKSVDLRTTHAEWYRRLFAPSVRAGLMPPEALAGYRNDAVYLQGSRYVPPRWEVVADAMEELFERIEAEEHPAVRVVLGHWLFGYIHPYHDGNGRMARFLMNVLLAAGNYPWTTIRVEQRGEYLSALDTASVDNDIRPFAEFVATCVAEAKMSYEERTAE